MHWSAGCSLRFVTAAAVHCFSSPLLQSLPLLDKFFKPLLFTSTPHLILLYQLSVGSFHGLHHRLEYLNTFLHLFLCILPRIIHKNYRIITTETMWTKSALEELLTNYKSGQFLLESVIFWIFLIELFVYIRGISYIL